MLAQERKDQEQISEQVREANLAFTRAHKGDASTKERETALQDLENGYLKYKEIISNLEVGRKFYNDLAKIVSRFRDDAKAFVHQRRMEASQLEAYALPICVHLTILSLTISIATTGTSPTSPPCPRCTFPSLTSASPPTNQPVRIIPRQHTPPLRRHSHHRSHPRQSKLTGHQKPQFRSQHPSRCAPLFLHPLCPAKCGLHRWASVSIPPVHLQERLRRQQQGLQADSLPVEDRQERGIQVRAYGFLEEPLNHCGGAFCTYVRACSPDIMPGGIQYI